MRPAALILLATLTACGPAAAAVDAPLEKAVAAFNMSDRLTASSVYVKDCGEPANGIVTCNACAADLIVHQTGEISVLAHADAYEIENVPAKPHATRAVEQSTHNTYVEAPDGLKEIAKGPAAFEAYLNGLYESGNAWCAAIGGNKTEAKNVIPDVARGKFVI